MQRSATLLHTTFTKTWPGRPAEYTCLVHRGIGEPLPAKPNHTRAELFLKPSAPLGSHSLCLLCLGSTVYRRLYTIQYGIPRLKYLPPSPQGSPLSLVTPRHGGGGKLFERIINAGTFKNMGTCRSSIGASIFPTHTRPRSCLRCHLGHRFDKGVVSRTPIYEYDQQRSVTWLCPSVIRALPLYP